MIAQHQETKRLLIFYKNNLDSDIESCIITLTEPTTPLIFYAQPGGTFSFVGYFMYQYPKQTCDRLLSKLMSGELEVLE